MPSLANGTANGTATRSPRFQLPALDFKFGSLTEGTNIPPPLPSPIEEEPSELPKTIQSADITAKEGTATNGTQTSPEAHRNGVKRSAADVVLPSSPTSSKAPASIRRLFSRNQMNVAFHANQDYATGEALSPRPISQSNASIATDRQSKRTSGWFRRLRGSDGQDSRRTSKVFFNNETAKPAAPVHVVPVHSGPPPPKIPEFKALGSKVDLGDDGGSLGSDLFKDIK